MLNEFELHSAWAAQRSSWPNKMQHIELKARLQTISGNAFFFHLLSFPKEKSMNLYIYIVYKVLCLCYIPVCFEEMRFFKEVQFSLHSIHFNQNKLF